MKNKELVLFFVIAFFVVVPLSSFAFVKEDNLLPAGYLYGHEYFEESIEYEQNQRESIKSMEKIVASFRKNNTNVPNDGWSFNYDGIHPDAYPDYYAGRYLNYHGKPVIMLTKHYKGNLFGLGTGKVKRELMELAETDELYFKKAKYSMSELVRTAGNISKIIKAGDYPQGEFYLAWPNISEHNNYISQGIYPLNKDNIKWFKKNVSNARYIKFYNYTRAKPYYME